MPGGPKFAGCRKGMVINMNQKDKERIERHENLNKFNSITKKGKPENQNQTHNVRKEGIQPINQKR